MLKAISFLGHGCWGAGGLTGTEHFMLSRTEPRTWSLALVSAAPARAVTVPASLSWQPRMSRVRLGPFWTISSCGPAVTTAPLRSQVTSASGGETSHWNVASSPSWTVRGVSSETSFTGGSSGRRSEAMTWITFFFFLLLSFPTLPQDARSHSPTNYDSLSEALLGVGCVGSPQNQDANSWLHLVSSLKSQPWHLFPSL